MSVDTYLALRIPAPDAAREEEDLVDLGALRHIGRDYVVVFVGDRFRDVEEEPEHFGPLYAGGLSPRYRDHLDPRGLLAIPEVGQGDFPDTYAELADGDPDGRAWLPIRRPRGRNRRKVLLVALSPVREQLLFDDPELVPQLLEARLEQEIPGTLELDAHWIALQRVLFDAAASAQRPAERAEAIAPRKGLSYFENRVVEASRVIPREVVADLAAWLGVLPGTTVADVGARAAPSEASLAFPESLGPCEADDHAPRARPDRRRTPRPEEVVRLQAALGRLADFHRAAAAEGKSVLSIRFRG
jgi:hypothetical protein